MPKQLHSEGKQKVTTVLACQGFNEIGNGHNLPSGNPGYTTDFKYNFRFRKTPVWVVAIDVKGIGVQERKSKTSDQEKCFS